MALTILGIDPGTHKMGVAVLRDRTLVGSGVHTLRNGDRPHDVIGQARMIILGYIREHGPEIVAIEKPLRIATKRASLVNVIAQELHARSKELGLTVVEILPEDVRVAVVGNPHAKKLDVATAIVEKGFPQLRDKLPVAPKRPVLGFSPREKYWLHMFDALAVAVAAQKPIMRSGPASRSEVAEDAPRIRLDSGEL